MLACLIAHKKAIVKGILNYGFINADIFLKAILYWRSALAFVQLILLIQQRLR